MLSRPAHAHGSVTPASQPSALVETCPGCTTHLPATSEGIGMQGHSARPPTVVYIAGSGRSGSTLVERVLGGVPGLTNVGELMDLPRRVAPGGERCGCGQAFGDCPFWTKVGQQAFGGWETGELAELERLRLRVARQRHLPKLLAW